MKDLESETTFSRAPGLPSLSWQKTQTAGLIAENANKPVMTAAYTCLFLFYFLYFFRPEDFIPGLAVLPLAKIAGALTGVALLGSILSWRVRLNPEIKLILGLFLYLCICIPMSLWPGGSFDLVVNGFLKYVLAIVATMWVLNTMGRLRRLILLQTFAMLAMATLALTQSRQAGRMFGVGNSFSDPNDFALNLCIVLPFCVALLLSSRSWFAKLFWTAAVGVTLLAIVSTYSRGGFLALTAVLLAMWRRFGIRTQTAALILVVVICFAAGALLIGGKSAYLDRLSTITDPHSDTTGSAQIREELLTRSVEVTLQHPIFGVGPGQFKDVSGSWHVTHNSYTQLSSEAGIPALLLFLLLIRRSFRNLRILCAAQKGSETWYLSGALYCALAGYIVGALFLSTSYWLVPYLLFAYVAILRNLSGGSNAQIGGRDIEPYRVSSSRSLQPGARSARLENGGVRIL